MSQNSSWVAPDSVNSLTNPVNYSSVDKKGTRTLFTEHCEICHGKKGDGKGVAGLKDPSPADLRSEQVQEQPDGAIWWKITHGHDRMIAYKGVLTAEQRWMLVSYIREL